MANIGTSTSALVFNPPQSPLEQRGEVLNLLDLILEYRRAAVNDYV